MNFGNNIDGFEGFLLTRMDISNIIKYYRKFNICNIN